MSIRARIYRWFMGHVILRWVVPKVDRDFARFLRAVDLMQKVKVEQPRVMSARHRLYWFHAASAGELESLWTLALKAAELSRSSLQTANPVSLVITCFSSSGLASVARLAEECTHSGAFILYAGASPFEGHWHKVFAVLRPYVFITVKYEAWPELWDALTQVKAKLVLVCARERGSLSLARRLSTVFALGRPETLLLAASSNDVEKLMRALPEAKVEMAADPRWDRVLNIISQPSMRAEMLLQISKDLPRPWGILSQVWPEDILIWRETLAKMRGTIFLVPHDVRTESVNRILDSLSWPYAIPHSTADWNAIVERVPSHSESISRSTDEMPKILMLDEFGMLLSFYPKCDWAYVGGGFGVGIHSVLEPAAADLPVSCGPEGLEGAAEAPLLEKNGLLHVIRTASDARAWCESLLSEGATSRRGAAPWVESMVGGTNASWHRIQEFLGP